MQSYANLTVFGPTDADVVARLRAVGTVAYVSPTHNRATVVYHEDLASQEPLAGDLSEHFGCPVLVVMTYATRVLLYALFENGRRTDAYQSESHADLGNGPDVPAGNAERLADAFDRPGAARRVETILRKFATEGNGYVYAANRHGDLCNALKLPTFAVNSSFGAIEFGELPMGGGFEPSMMVRT
jgi:hypothetical protein